MEAKLKSRNPKTTTDALVQTDKVTQKSASNQTENVKGVDFEVQVNIQPVKNAMCTQTIKEENQEVALPNRPSSIKSKQSKKRKLTKTRSAPRNLSETSIPLSTASAGQAWQRLFVT